MGARSSWSSLATAKSQMTSHQHTRWAGLLNRCWLFSWGLPFLQSKYGEKFLQASLRVSGRKRKFHSRPSRNPTNTQVDISARPEQFRLSALLLCAARPAEHAALQNTWRAEIAFGTKDAGNSAVHFLTLTIHTAIAEEQVHTRLAPALVF